MEYKPRSNSKILDDIKSAGQNYLGIYLEDILLHTHQLEDRMLKKQLIERHYNNQKCFSDKEMGGTRVRVNAATRIIQAGKVIYALEQIDGADPRVTDEAVDAAKDTIRKINSGEIVLPKLI